jgi:hypothetical protein
MPTLLVPIHEYNKCHNPDGPAGGQFCSTEGGGSIPGDCAAAMAAGKRPTPIRVKTVEEGVTLLLQGKVIELENEAAVATLLDKLGAMVADALSKGRKAPNYDLCNVSVKGTNLFCTEKLRTAEYPEGIERIKMPQFTGPPRPGSPADKLPRMVFDGKTTDRVDAALAFVDHLEARGIKVSEVEQVPAAGLKATQAQLIGAKVAEMVLKGGSEGQDSGEPAFISRDNYVLDGHHRWAANVWRDLQRRKGRITMPVYRIDAPISELYHLAVEWTNQFGIEPAHGPERR